MVPSRQRFFSHPSPREQIEEECSGQPIPDSGLSFSSATAGGSPPLY